MNSGIQRTIDRIESQAAPLSSLGLVRTGIMGFEYWALEPHVFELSDEPKGRVVRLLTNSQIDPFRFRFDETVRLYKSAYVNPVISLDCPQINRSTAEFFSLPKIVLRGVARRATAAFDQQGHALLVAVHGFAAKEVDHFFVLGLLNSSLVDWLHRTKFYFARIPKGSLRYPISFWQSVPVRYDDLDAINRIATLAEQMTSGQGSEAIQRSIDNEVCSLYGVSAAELS